MSELVIQLKSIDTTLTINNVHLSRAIKSNAETLKRNMIKVNEGYNGPNGKQYCIYKYDVKGINKQVKSYVDAQESVLRKKQSVCKESSTQIITYNDDDQEDIFDALLNGDNLII